MQITLSVDGETYAYHIDDIPGQVREDFMDAVEGFEGLLKAAFPSFDGHGLVALCPGGELHEGVEGEVPGAEGEEKKPDEDGGVDLGKGK